MTLNNLKKVSLKTKHINEYVVDGKKSLTVILPTSSFLKSDIPNKANSRDFTGLKNKAVKEMVSTLRNEPEMFRFKNLGIRMVATDFTRNEDEITLYFDEDEGIFNGGHTYEISKTYGRSNAFVNMTVDFNLPKEKLVDISLALNMSKKLEAESQGEKVGAFQWIKDILSDEKITYKEGDQGEHPVKDVLRVANVFKLGKGNKYSDSSLIQSMRTVSTIVRQNNDSQLLSYTRFLLPDMWDLYKELRESKTIIKNLPNNFVKKEILVQGIALILLSGVRYMTEVNNNNIPVWKADFNKEKALAMCEKLSKQIGKELKKNPYKDMKAEAVHKDNNFHMLVKVIFANELNK